MYDTKGDRETVRGPAVLEAEPPVAALAAQAVDAMKVYGRGETEVRALDGVTIGFEVGRLTAIMGPSGSGKSTLLHCLAGLDSLTSGAVFIGDTDLTTLSDKQLTELRRDHVGFVFQAFNLVPTLTAEENITLPLALGGRKPDKEWLDTLVTALGIDGRLRHRPSELSGGQQQRVAAARAMVTRPELIFADEPTGNLDSRSATELLEMIRRAVDDFGQTVVMVTHDARAASYADRVVFLADGQHRPGDRAPDYGRDPRRAQATRSVTSCGLALKSVLAKKLRLFSTALSVMLGIAFLSGTLVFTDTIQRTFDDLFATVFAEHRQLRAVVDHGRPRDRR